MHREPLTGNDVWHGDDMAARTDWLFTLTAAMQEEISHATGTLVEQRKTWPEVGADNFQIPLTRRLLDEVAQFLEVGPGVAKISGFAQDLQADARRLMFNGIGHHLGTPVSMSLEGMMMSDVTDVGASTGEKYGQVRDADDNDFLSSRARVHSTGQLRFHNDRCDVVALLCAANAAEGGVSRLVSVPMIHNRMLAECPELLECLFAPYDRSRLGEEFGDNAAWYSMPVFGLCEGAFTCHYSRTFIEAAQLNPRVKKMTEQQWQAMDAMHEIADALAFENEILPGELQLLNNHVIFHGRTAYSDAPDQAPRLLHRLWLSMPNSRPLPDSFRVLFRNTGAGTLRGGIPKAA